MTRKIEILENAFSCAFCKRSFKNYMGVVGHQRSCLYVKKGRKKTQKEGILSELEGVLTNISLHIGAVGSKQSFTSEFKGLSLQKLKRTLINFREIQRDLETMTPEERQRVKIFMNDKKMLRKALLLSLGVVFIFRALEEH